MHIYKLTGGSQSNWQKLVVKLVQYIEFLLLVLLRVPAYFMNQE
jgi:hypothetical protein